MDAAEKAKAIFLSAIDDHQPDEWPAYLEQACGGDESLRRRVEELLNAHREENSLIDRVDATADLQLERAGEEIGPYKLREKLGEGGFGVVWAAEQRSPIRRKVAVKVIKPGMDTAAVIARFELERQALALMDHPNIAKVLDAGTTSQGRPYFVMELIPGVPITEYCDRNALSVRERLELFNQVCRAVQHAHQKGIVHRDIKPSNVLLMNQDDEPVLKVIDFGVAKALHQPLTEKSIYTGVYQAIGTLAYMSPEQAEPTASDIDTRADIYGLGTLLYELLTGVTPFDKHRLESAAFREACRIIREEDPPRASVKISSLGETATSVATERKTDPPRLERTLKGDLDVILMKALEKDRRRRYDTANELAKDIERYLRHENVLARRPTLAYRLKKSLRRNAMLVGTSVAVFLALIVGIVGLLIGIVRVNEGREVALVAKKMAVESEKAAREALAREAKARGIVERQRSTLALSVAMGDLPNHDMPRLEELLSIVESGRADLSNEFEAQLLRAQLANNRPDAEIQFDREIISAEYSPDGDYLAVGFRDGSVLIIDRATLEQVELISPYRKGRMWGARTPMKFSTCGEYLAIGREDLLGDPRVSIWRWKSREPLMEYVEHDAEIDSIAVAANGTLAASGDQSGTIKLWQMDGGHVERVLKGHKKIVRRLAFAPDGRTLASVDLAYQVLLWDTTTGQQLASLPGHTRQLYGVGFSSDGQTLVSAGELRAKFWDMTSEPPRESRNELFQHVCDLEFIPDEDVLVLANANGTVELRELHREKPLLTLAHQGRVYGVAVSPQGSEIASFATDNRLCFWDWRDRAKKQEVTIRPHFHPPVAAATESTAISLIGPEGQIQMWYPDTGELVTLATPNMQITSLALTSDGKTLAAGDENGVITIWNVQTKSCVKSLLGHVDLPDRDAGSIYTLAFSTIDPNCLVSGGFGPEVRLWNIETKESLILEEGDDYENAVLAVAVSPRGDMVASVGPFGTVTVRDISGATPQDKLFSIPGTSRAYGLAFSPDQKWLATTEDFRNGTLKLINLESGDYHIWKGHASSVHGITFSPSGNRLVTGSVDQSIKFWDVETREEVGVIRTTRQVQRLLFLPDQKTLAVAGNAGYLMLLSAKMRKGSVAGMVESRAPIGPKKLEHPVE